MNKLELCKEFIDKLFSYQQIEELYKFTTRDTKYYCIEENLLSDLFSFAEKIKKYENYEIRYLECDLFVKAIFEKNQEKFHVYFDIKRNKIVRIEFSEKI